MYFSASIITPPFLDIASFYPFSPPPPAVPPAITTVHPLTKRIGHWFLFLPKSVPLCELVLIPRDLKCKREKAVERAFDNTAMGHRVKGPHSLQWGYFVFSPSPDTMFSNDRHSCVSYWKLDTISVWAHDYHTYTRARAKICIWKAGEQQGE